MSYIIDGHNLIGVLPDIQLHEPDDETRLLEKLRAYRAHSGGPSMMVFFDSGPLRALGVRASGGRVVAASNVGEGHAGQPADLSTPGVQVRFSAPGQTADDAIVTYLWGRAEPGQYAVITNDQGLAQRVREAGASVLRASDFAAKLAIHPRSVRASEVAEPTYDAHHPAFADIYASFIAAEKNQARFQRETPTAASVWIERLYEGDPQLAEQAAQWLGQFGGPDALGPLCDALTHAHSGVRAAALLALGFLGNPAAQPDMCRCLAKDANSMVREAAAQSLGRIGDRTVEAALEAAARMDTKSKVRKAAQISLAQVRARRGEVVRPGNRSQP